MLVLSRKTNESIIIAEDITVVVAEIRGNRVRLAIEAPKAVPVHRREVFDAIRRNQGTNDGQVRDACEPAQPPNSCLMFPKTGREQRAG